MSASPELYRCTVRLKIELGMASPWIEVTFVEICEEAEDQLAQCLTNFWPLVYLPVDGQEEDLCIVFEMKTGMQIRWQPATEEEKPQISTLHKHFLSQQEAKVSAQLLPVRKAGFIAGICVGKPNCKGYLATTEQFEKSRCADCYR